MTADIAKLREALAHVEAATGPDTELDKHIDVIAGSGFADPDWPNYCARATKPWTASLDAVVGLIEREMPNELWSVEKCHSGGYRGKVTTILSTHADQLFDETYHSVDALALLAAFLRALIAEAEQREDVAS